MRAKDKFREGYIRLKRPFEFANLKYPLQELTVIYAYSEKPIIRKELSHEAKLEIERIENSSRLMYPEAQKERDIEYILNTNSSYEEIYLGEIVQCTIEGELCRFYPEEYDVLSNEALQALYDEEGYHVIIENDTVLTLPSVKDRMFYLQSRCIDKTTALKWSVKEMKDMIYFKPYFELLDLFARTIYPDPFYTEVEGIIFQELI